jgi:hypothetical protein
MATQNKSVAKVDAPKPGTEVSTVGRSTSLISKMAAKMQMEPERFLDTLKQTAFRQRGKNGAPAVPVTNEQMAMLLHIADKYGLDPFVKQLYAFASDGGISPIVPVDGWIEMINRHPMFESMEIETPEPKTPKDDYWVAVTITRKDRAKPIRIEEFMIECWRDTDSWNSHPRRMLRHKGIIQCGRVAFGYSGIFDPDEEERVFAAARDITPARGKPTTTEPQRRKSEPAAHVEPEGSAAITLDQATSIADKLKEEGVELNALLARFQIGALEELPFVMYGQALAAIDDLSNS